MPGSSLRAPLLWLLLPFMAGIALADSRPVTSHWMPVLTLLAAGFGCLGWWCAGQAGIGARLGWSTTMIGVGMAGGYIALQVRSPRLDAVLAVPREAMVILEAEQLFPSAPTRKTLSGLGRIVSTESHLKELTGQRIYFSASKRHSIVPLRSGRYQVRGVLQTLASSPTTENIAGFQRYLESAGIRLTLTRVQILREERPPGWFRLQCSQIEGRLETILRQGIETQPAATSLYLGMLLGEKAALSPEQQDAFMRSGTFHIFCIAGLHVGVIATAMVAVLQLLRVPRRGAIIGGLVMLWFYVQVTGADIPAERAFLMIAFLWGSRLFRLPRNSLAALAAAALLTLCLDPQQLFSAGFQMSYAVVSSLVVMCPPLVQRWQETWRPWRDLPEAAWGRWRHGVVSLGRTLLAASATTWVALLASIPSSIGYFGLFSPGGLLANLIIVPMAMLTIVAGFISLIGGLCGLTGVSLIFNHAAALIITAMDWLIAHGVELPGVYYPAHFILPWMAPVALTALVAVMLAGASTRWSTRWGATLWPPLTIMLILFFWVKFG